MPEFQTHGVLAVTTGILMGDIGAVYEVVTYLIGRPAFTHDLAAYGDAAREAILIAHPDVPAEANGLNWQRVKADAIARFGETFALDEALRDCLLDGKGPMQTLVERIEHVNALKGGRDGD